MSRKLNIINLLVDDYDKALDFYVGKLGFEKMMDMPYEYEGMKFRWVTVNLPEQKDVEIAFMVAQPQDKDLIGKQGGAYPFLTLTTTDVDADLKNLKDAGVEITTDMMEDPWGKGFNFKDLYGNVIYLIQPNMEFQPA